MPPAPALPDGELPDEELPDEESPDEELPDEVSGPAVSVGWVVVSVASFSVEPPPADELPPEDAVSSASR
ncbi:hypothetical protein, partial [Azospirillum sp. A39]|uniref:hypothetical protein n=1 Tax=Azospirillum sp. A39 TaxID=3462279 RepID=UPI004045ACCE